MTPRMLTGGCVCGAVLYTVPDAVRYALNCHCSQCRRATHIFVGSKAAWSVIADDLPQFSELP